MDVGILYRVAQVQMVTQKDTSKPRKEYGTAGGQRPVDSKLLTCDLAASRLMIEECRIGFDAPGRVE